MNTKRGLSDVVTTVLIILLVLASVVIIWTFVRPAIQSGAGKVSGACVSLDLSIVSCVNKYNSSNVYQNTTITVERGADDVNLQEVVLVLDKKDGNTASNYTGSKIEALGRKTFTINQETDKATVTGQVMTEAGELNLCSPTAVKVACT